MAQAVDLESAQDAPKAATDGPKSMTYFNKKKYALLAKELDQSYGEMSQEILSTICKVLNFDPTVPTFSKETIQYQKEHMRRLAEQKGVTLYQLVHKPYYERNKDKCIARVKEYKKAQCKQAAC